MEPIEEFYGDVAEAPAEHTVESATRALEGADGQWRQALSAEWVAIYDRLILDVDALFERAGLQRKEIHLSIYATQLVTGAEVVFTDFTEDLAPSNDPASYADSPATGYWPDETCAEHGYGCAAPCGECDVEVESPAEGDPIDPKAFFATGSPEKILAQLATCGYCGQPVSQFEAGASPATSTILGDVPQPHPYDALPAVNSALDPKEFFKPKAMTAVLDAMQQHKDIEVGISNAQIAANFKQQMLSELLSQAKYNPALQLVDLENLAKRAADQYVKQLRAVVEVDDAYVATEQLGTQEPIRPATKADIDELYHKEVPANLFSEGDRVKLGDYFRGYVVSVNTGFDPHAYYYDVQVQDSNQVLYNIPEKNLTLWPFEAPLK